MLKTDDSCGVAFVNTGDRSVTEVFNLFDLIHILTTDHDTVTRITREVRLLAYYINFCYCQIHCPFSNNSYKQVVEDFASDNVVYLELRTTPKVTSDCSYLLFLVS